MSELLYTKQGRALRVDGEDLIGHNGHVARLHGDMAYGPDGKYVGTVVGDRLVYRATDSARVKSPYVRRGTSGHAYADRVASAVSGEEPPI